MREERMGNAFEYQPEKLDSMIDSVIEKNLAGRMTSGVVVQVCHDGKPVYARAAGLADIEAGRPMQENTLFRLGFHQQRRLPVCAVAASIQQGRMDFEDPVTKWLPYFTPKLANGSVPVITIRQLLSHMSGLDHRWAQKEDGPYAKAGVSDGLDITGLTLEENLKRLASAPLHFAPGSDWLYSLAPDVLGAVVGKACGTDFQTALSELVLETSGNDGYRLLCPGQRKSQSARPHDGQGAVDTDVG